MGYYTRYTLSIAPPPAMPDRAVLDEQTDYGTLQDHIDQLSEGIKWYHHEQDMLAISKRWPAYVFVLDGIGEEKGDVWRKFFQDGRFETVKQHAWVPPEKPSWAPKPQYPAQVVGPVPQRQDAYIIHVPGRFQGHEYLVAAFSTGSGIADSCVVIPADKTGQPTGDAVLFRFGTTDVGQALMDLGIKITGFF